VNIDELRIGDLLLVDGSGLISKAIEDVEYGRQKAARRYIARLRDISVTVSLSRLKD
jgi:hypothetical protein